MMMNRSWRGVVGGRMEPGFASVVPLSQETLPMILPEQVHALKAELHSFMSENMLDAGSEWVSPEEFSTRPCFRSGSLEFGSPCLLVLILGKFLYNVIWHTPPGQQGALYELKDKFYEIVHRHGFCSDFEDAGVSGPADAMFLKEFYHEDSGEDFSIDDLFASGGNEQ